MSDVLIFVETHWELISTIACTLIGAVIAILRVTQWGKAHKTALDTVVKAVEKVSLTSSYTEPISAEAAIKAVRTGAIVSTPSTGPGSIVKGITAQQVIDSLTRRGAEQVKEIVKNSAPATSGLTQDVIVKSVAKADPKPGRKFGPMAIQIARLLFKGVMLAKGIPVILVGLSLVGCMTTNSHTTRVTAPDGTVTETTESVKAFDPIGTESALVQVDQALSIVDKAMSMAKTQYEYWKAETQKPDSDPMAQDKMDFWANIILELGKATLDATVGPK